MLLAVEDGDPRPRERGRHRLGGPPQEAGAVAAEAVHGFVAQFAEPGREAARQGLFGRVVAVPDEAPLLDRIIGMTGRDPGWTPG